MHKKFFSCKKNNAKQVALNQDVWKAKNKFKGLLLKDNMNEEVAWKFVHIHVEMQHQLMD